MSSATPVLESYPGILDSKIRSVSNEYILELDPPSGGDSQLPLMPPKTTTENLTSPNPSFIFDVYIASPSYLPTGIESRAVRRSREARH
jgi:hypothetical protein